jgi:catechol 2,3-dioxygenase-like lactoylglutathione lyase family enzyme
MGPTIDHVAVPAHDPERAAAFLARALGVVGVVPDGPDGDMFAVPLAAGRVLFVGSPDPPGHHIAFRVGEDDVAAVVARLRADGVAFGNDPEHPDNGEAWDPLGGAGRVYFASPDGHLFEVAAG